MAYEIDLKNKTCVIMGGSRGIGAECCRQLARAGANIAFSYNKSPDRADALMKEIETHQVKARTYGLNLGNPDQVKSMIDEVYAEFGSIDVLVYNAAILIASPLEDITIEQWRQTMAINLDGAFYSAKYAIPYMLKGNGGKIIFISSNATINGGGSTVAYPASKAGLEGLAKQLLKEFLSKGINVNIVSPAVIDTELLRERYPTDEMIAEYGKNMPVGRVGKPEDIANAVVFFASDKSDYICGHNLLVDGGRTYYIK